MSTQTQPEVFDLSKIWIYWREHYTGGGIDSPFHGVMEGENVSLCGMLKLKPTNEGGAWDGGYYNLADGKSAVHCKRCLRKIELLKEAAQSNGK